MSRPQALAPIFSALICGTIGDQRRPPGRRRIPPPRSLCSARRRSRRRHPSALTALSSRRRASAPHELHRPGPYRACRAWCPRHRCIRRWGSSRRKLMAFTSGAWSRPSTFVAVHHVQHRPFGRPVSWNSSAISRRSCRARRLEDEGVAAGDGHGTPTKAPSSGS